MKKVCYLLNTYGINAVMTKIEDTFPCFINGHRFSSEFYEVEIECREDDLPAIERMLAPYVQRALWLSIILAGRAGAFLSSASRFLPY